MSIKSERPYISSSIEDLEAVFKAHPDELRRLKQLVQELSFRKTKRARKLLALVFERLTEFIVTVRVPSQFEGATLSKIAAEIQEKCPNGLPPEIKIDFEGLKFIRPAGAVFLSNLVHWMNEQGTKVSFCNMDEVSEPIKFLDDSLFFEQHCGKKIRESTPSSTTTQPTSIRRCANGWPGIPAGRSTSRPHRHPGSTPSRASSPSS